MFYCFTSKLLLLLTLVSDKGSPRGYELYMDKNYVIGYILKNCRGLIDQYVFGFRDVTTFNLKKTTTPGQAVSIYCHKNISNQMMNTARLSD